MRSGEAGAVGLAAGVAAPARGDNVGLKKYQIALQELPAGDDMPKWQSAKGAGNGQMIRLRPYLDQVDARSVCQMLCLDLFKIVAARLGSRCGARQAAEWDALEKLVANHSNAEQRAEVVSAFDALLARECEQIAETERNQAAAAEDLLGLLKEVLQTMSSGGERGLSRLQDVETALSRAAAINDLGQLKSAIQQTKTKLREEMQQQRKETGEALRNFGAQFQRAQDGLSALAPDLPTREAACAALAETLRNPVAGAKSYLVVCALERLQVLRSRFGQGTADRLVRAFVDERAKPNSGDATVYRWTDATLVWIVQDARPMDELRTSLEAWLQQGFEYTTLSAGRSILLSVQFRWLCEPLPGAGAAQLIEEIDRFSRNTP